MNHLEEETIIFIPLEQLWKHDMYTFQHSLRVADLLYQFGKFLNLSQPILIELYQLGALHDVGKVLVPKEVLNKKGGLTEDERAFLFKHTIYGVELLKEYNFSEEFLQGVLYHHENYDSTGYPDRIKSDMIPFYAKMLRIVDSFDAMTNERTYQKAYPVDWALKELKDLKLKNYDPQLVDQFVKLFEEKR
ncbi:HD-GYP domain-containing protein [Metabacillus herbersteinensis]|uniref:HD-GYP domain-containing protein n=1 Tax=Metabacillus herbersteinensis TaxID=283816 RepID=A0ABV6GJ93_9BACI